MTKFLNALSLAAALACGCSHEDEAADKRPHPSVHVAERGDADSNGPVAKARPRRAELGKKPEPASREKIVLGPPITVSIAPNYHSHFLDREDVADSVALVAAPATAKPAVCDFYVRVGGVDTNAGTTRD